MGNHRLDKKIRRLFLFAGTLVMKVVIAKTGAPLKTPSTPEGILDLEFAYHKAAASVVVNSWAGTGGFNIIRAAKVNIWLDFIFLFFYALLLYYSCNAIASSFDGFLFIAAG